MAHQPPPDRDALAASILHDALAYARHAARRPTELVELCQDRAVDAVVRCLDHAGDARDWHAYAWTAIRRAVRGAIGEWGKRPRLPKADPGEEPCDKEVPAPLTADLGFELREALPPEEAEAVRLYYLCGHTMREAGGILGISHECVRQRLRAAAIRLGAGQPIPERPGHAKRLRRA